MFLGKNYQYFAHRAEAQIDLIKDVLLREPGL